MKTILRSIGTGLALVALAIVTVVLIAVCAVIGIFDGRPWLADHQRGA